MLWGRYLRLAGPRRSLRNNRHLAGVLALNAGILNSVGFVAVAFYSSHMTGLTALLADQLVLGRWSVVTVAGAAIASFVLGAMVCALVFNWGRRRSLESRYANVLVLEAVLILVFGMFAQSLGSTHRTMIIVVILCFTMGLQNAIITKLSNAQIRTTHVTGMVTDIGIELGKLAYRSRHDDLAPVVADPAKLLSLSVLVVLFFLGGMIGALGFQSFGFPVVIPVAASLLVLALPPVLHDLAHWASSD